MVRKTIRRRITKTDPIVVNIEVEDLIDELTAENNRLVNELLFTNKCLDLLNEIKDHMELIHKKYEDYITAKEYKQWQSFKQSMITAIDDHNNNNNTRHKTEVKTIGKERQLTDNIRQAFNHIIIGGVNKSNDQISSSLADPCTTTTTSTTVHTAVPNLKTTASNVKTVKTIAVKTAEVVSIDLSQSDADISDDTDCCDADDVVAEEDSIGDDDDDGCWQPEDTSSTVNKTIADRLISNTIEESESIDKSTTIVSQRIADQKTATTDGDPNWLLLAKKGNLDPISGQHLCPKPDCNKHFPTQRQLYNHCYDVHCRLKKHVCNHLDCNKSFATIKRLNRHSASHRRKQERLVRRYVCHYDGCDKQYIQRKHLRRHLLSHSSDSPYVCQEPDCGKAFKTQCKLKLHQTIHATNRPTYRCPECGKSYLCDRTLANHRRFNHSLVNQLRCDIDGCDEIFKNYSQRRKHKMSVHNFKYAPIKVTLGDYPCQWPGCEYKTTKKPLLALHTRIHTGERPYGCDWPECGKRFRNRADFREHYNYHLNVKPYGCQWPGCEYRATCYGNIVNHTKCVHKKHTGISS